MTGTSHRKAAIGVALALTACAALAVSALRASRVEHGSGDVSRPDLPVASRETRVLIHTGIEALYFRGAAPIAWTCADAGADSPPRVAPLEPEATPSSTEPGSADAWSRLAPLDDGAWALAGQIIPACRALRLHPQSDDGVEVSLDPEGEERVARRYPGVFHALRTEGEGTFDVVNLVDVETYTACVVAGEVWPTFSDTALKAQAIAVRTFALYQMEHRESRTHDVASTQGSQVYRGLRDDALGRRAAAAARDTRGVVCAMESGGTVRLFCAYYSAACGGVTQSGAVFGPRSAVAPLSGGVRCDHCRGAPPGYFRWGPARVNRDAALDRLWPRFADARGIDRVARVDALDRTEDGRVVSVRVTGDNGTVFETSAERFRLALGGYVVRSTAFDVRMEGEDIVFDGGRGFGHGLGLCQWGAQGQSLLGKTTAEILRFYYPGMRLARAY